MVESELSLHSDRQGQAGWLILAMNAVTAFSMFVMVAGGRTALVCCRAVVARGAHADRKRQDRGERQFACGFGHGNSQVAFLPAVRCARRGGPPNCVPRHAAARRRCPRQKTVRMSWLVVGGTNTCNMRGRLRKLQTHE